MDIRPNLISCRTAVPNHRVSSSAYTPRGPHLESLPSTTLPYTPPSSTDLTPPKEPSSSPLNSQSRPTRRAASRRAPQYDLEAAWSPLNPYLTDSPPSSDNEAGAGDTSAHVGSCCHSTHGPSHRGHVGATAFGGGDRHGRAEGGQSQHWKHGPDHVYEEATAAACQSSEGRKAHEHGNVNTRGVEDVITGARGGSTTRLGLGRGRIKVYASESSCDEYRDEGDDGNGDGDDEAKRRAAKLKRKKYAERTEKKLGSKKRRVIREGTAGAVWKEDARKLVDVLSARTEWKGVAAELKGLEMKMEGTEGGDRGGGGGRTAEGWKQLWEMELIPRILSMYKS